MELSYILNSTHILEYQFYLAFHDKKLHQRCIKLLVSISGFVILGILLLNSVNVISLVSIALAIIAAIYFFPKFYWNAIYRKIERTVLENNPQFAMINLQLKDHLLIKTGSNNYKVERNKIHDVFFTKNTCILLYINKQGAIDSLLIPLEALGKGMQEFIDFVRKDDNHAGQTSDHR